MGPPSYMPSVVDRNVVMGRMTTYKMQGTCINKKIVPFIV